MKEGRPRLRWRLPLVLFLATVASVAEAGAAGGSALGFALPLLSILLAHEFGHYFAARAHGVPASLPHFLPLPWLSPFGTLGALIFMEPRWRDRRQLFDIGAAGPWAGLVVSLVALYVGLRWSPVLPTESGGAQVLEGQSLLYLAMKRWALGPIPPGHDVFLHPTAFAGWAGLLVTFLNLFPIWQLDGGHVAYALFGDHHRRWSFAAPLLPASLALYNGLRYGPPLLAEPSARAWSALLSSTVSWTILTCVLGAVMVVRWRRGRPVALEHPVVPGPPLTGVRRALAWATLALFVCVFLPTPWLILEP